jgi:hypothetical protein
MATNAELIAENDRLRAELAAYQTDEISPALREQIEEVINERLVDVGVINNPERETLADKIDRRMQERVLINALSMKG